MDRIQQYISLIRHFEVRCQTVSLKGGRQIKWMRSPFSVPLSPIIRSRSEMRSGAPRSLSCIPAQRRQRGLLGNQPWCQYLWKWETFFSIALKKTDSLWFPVKKQTKTNPKQSTTARHKVKSNKRCWVSTANQLYVINTRTKWWKLQAWSWLTLLMSMHRSGFSIFWHKLISFSGGVCLNVGTQGGRASKKARFHWNQNFRLHSKSGTFEGNLCGFKVPPESVLLCAGLMFHYTHNDLRVDTLRAGDRQHTRLKAGWWFVALWAVFREQHLPRDQSIS